MIMAQQGVDLRKDLLAQLGPEAGLLHAVESPRRINSAAGLTGIASCRHHVLGRSFATGDEWPARSIR